MNAAKKTPSTTTKKIQLTFPQSPAESPATSPTSSEKHHNHNEIKQSLNSKHLSVNKKESLESLKKHQGDKKRQRQQELLSEDGGNIDLNIIEQQQHEPERTKHRGKSPYDILFDQNQNLANELEVDYSLLLLILLI